MSEHVTRRGFIGAAAVAAGGISLSAAEAAKGGEAAADPAGKVRIVAINCSRRAGENTAKALQIALEAAKALAPDRIEIELVEVAGKNLHGEVAAGIELAPGQVDDFLPIADKIRQPGLGGLIFGTPTYFSSMSSPCKELIERMTVFYKPNFALANVVAGVLATGGTRHGGQEMAITSVQAALHCQHMIVVGAGGKTSRFGACIWAGAEGGVEEASNRTAAEDLGRRVAEVALALRAAGPPAGASYRSS
ncbi:MAG: flavodoxin family protein [Thermoguttaceae bacterium]